MKGYKTMKKKTLINLSHLTSLLFGLSLGIIITMLCLFTMQNCEATITYLLFPITIMIVAIILRVVTLVVYKKNLDKYNF